MSSIRSIIIFNGGSAGDFLRTVCLEQINSFDRYSIDDNGMIETALDDNYFKELCKTQQQTDQSQTIDPDRCFEIENAHSYFDWFGTMTTNLFYIHYEDSKTPAVVQAFANKRKQSEFDNWIQKIMPSHVPTVLLSQINQNNFVDALGIFWKKNIQQWQANSMLTPIPLQDLFDLTALTKWVERLCNQPLSNPKQLSDTYQAWLNKNLRLATALL